MLMQVNVLYSLVQERQETSRENPAEDHKGNEGPRASPL